MLLDYGTKPLVLKQEARLWCLAVRDFDNRKDVVSLKLEECTKENLRDLLKDTEELIYHNGVSFDAPMLKLFDVMDYRVGFEGESDTLYGKPIQIIDTLVLSKLLRQDRFGGHSVEAWGRVLGYPKMDFHAFDEYSDLMVTYCENDTLVQAEIYQALLEELGPKGFDEYAKAYRLELKLADLTVSQEHHGFAFDTKRAEGVLDKFNTLLEDIRSKVDPLLPPRPLNKGEQKTFIPPAKQFKINGDPTAHMLNFIAKIDAELSEDKETITFEGKEFKLPLEAGISIKETLPGSIDSLDHLKAHLLDLGWDPLEWKERDLSRDTKKNKLVGDKLDETIQRYIDDTLTGPYKKYRLELMGIKDETKLAAYINDQKEHYKIAVPVSPMLRTGTAKELCPNLVSMGKQAEFATDVVKYLTFKHRRNSVAGGKEDESGNPLSGYLSQVRADNRISTPADTNGANGKYILIFPM